MFQQAGAHLICHRSGCLFPLQEQQVSLAAYGTLRQVRPTESVIKVLASTRYVGLFPIMKVGMGVNLNSAS